MEQDMDILAPAGSPEGLVAAIKGGCDAVYLAGKWRIQTQKIPATAVSYTTPKNLTPGKTYKVAIAAKVNGT